MIDTSSWKEFCVGDFFHGVRGTSCKMQELNEGETPVIAAARYNQGIAGYYDVPSEYENAITISCNGVGCGSTYYHDYPFAITGDAIVLENIGNVPIGALHFIASVYDVYFSRKYSYTDKCSADKAEAECILLPATSEGQPDWDYMESYMKAVMEESEKSLENLRKVNDTKHLIDVSGWGEFRVGDLFDKLTLKCLKKDFNKAIDCSEEQTDEFSLPLTNAKHFNNGIQFYGRPDDWESAEMTIDIVSNGAIATGDVYAQPQRTGVLWDSYLVKCKYDITSELVLQYMSCVIQRCVKQYFGWDDKCTWDKVKEQMIRLPITSTGEPDWQYMEDYMRRIMNKSEQIISDLQIGV